VMLKSRLGLATFRSYPIPGSIQVTKASKRQLQRTNAEHQRTYCIQ
jgi:hypothetical protein